MNNHPFYSTNTNIYDESFSNSTPTNLNGQNVIVAQEQQRKMFDSMNTAIVGFPSNNPYAASTYVPGSFIQARRHFVPGGVQFFFMPQHQVHQSQQQQRMFNFNSMSHAANQYQESCFCPNTLEQQMAMNSLNKHGLESLEYQQQLSKNPFFPQYQQQNIQNPFQLKFHQNVGTSTNISNASSRSTPDFCNMGGFRQMQSGAQTSNPQDMETNKYDICSKPAAQFQQNPFQNEYPGSVRKLVLSKPPQPITGHVADVLDEICDPCKKKVSFLEGEADSSHNKSRASEVKIYDSEENVQKVDRCEQASFPCECAILNNSRCETSKPRLKVKRSVWPKRKPKSSGGSDSGSSEDDGKKKQKKVKQKKNKKKQREDEFTTTSGSE